jgi:sugar phosphate isomerase/epimerase
MKHISRRAFLRQTAAAGGAACVASVRSMDGFPLSLPIGIQSFDLTERLRADFQGTLKTLSGYGYQWVDWLAGGRTTVASVAAMPAKEVHKLFAAAGLATYNVHFTWADLHEGWAKTIQEIHDYKATSVGCTTAPGRNKTAEDWKWHAEGLNALGEKTKREGVLTGYHPHPLEFTEVEGIVPWDLLLQTDPGLVKMQIDVGACAVAGKDPEAYLTRYPDHYYSIHVKDVKDGKLGVAVGEGVLDWKKILTAAQHAGLRHYVVETGASDDVVMEKTKRSIDYLRSFRI